MSKEEQANIKFVELVEQYPCIYDYSHQDHCKRDAIEKAWSEIGCEVNESVARCKEKWKNLRTAFARSMKKSGSSGNKRVRSYYLKDAMQFIRPFMKSKLQYGNLSMMDETMSEVLEDHDNDRSADSELDIVRVIQCPIDDGEIRIEHDGEATANMNVNKLKRYKSVVNEADKCIIDYFDLKKQSLEQNSNPDLQFLKSLLPDIEKMNDYQKRQFKKRILDVVDSILCDDPHVKRRIH